MTTDIRTLYKNKVAKDHKSKVVREYFSLYAWFWFHTQFWLAPLDRRPYTYIMRDWIYPHMKLFIVLSIIWLAGCLAWLYWQPYPAAIILMLSSLLWAHLVWGSEWIPGEQEDPQITDI
jgi:hypothetical protein